MPSRRGTPRADFIQNRRAILDAAAGLIATSPHVSVAQVAAAAGVTRTTVYRHFADREALLDELAAETALRLLPRVVDALAAAPLADSVERFAAAVVAHATEHRHLLVALSTRVEDLARRTVDDDAMVGVLRRRRETGELVSSLPDRWLAACVRAVCLTAAFDDRSPEEVRRDLAATLQLLLRGEPPGHRPGAPT